LRRELEVVSRKRGVRSHSTQVIYCGRGLDRNVHSLEGLPIPQQDNYLTTIKIG